MQAGEDDPRKHFAKRDRGDAGGRREHMAIVMIKNSSGNSRPHA